METLNSLYVCHLAQEALKHPQNSSQGSKIRVQGLKSSQDSFNSHLIDKFKGWVSWIGQSPYGMHWIAMSSSKHQISHQGHATWTSRVT